MPIPPFVRSDLDALGIDLAPTVLEQMSHYLDLLLEANQRINLTAVRQREDAWRRLIVDSLTALPGLDGVAAGGAVIDVGSGGGLPGIPLGLARPDLSVVLLDATGKKVGFLQRCIDELGLSNLSAIAQRAETLGHQSGHRAHYDVALSRAIGSISIVLEYCLPLVKVGGTVLAMKGPKAEQELADAADALAVLAAGELTVYEAYPPDFDNELVIICVCKDRPTPHRYPRPPGVPKGAPL